MGSIIQNQYSRNQQLTRGNLTGLAATGNQLQEPGLLGKRPHDVNSNQAYNDLAQGRAVSVRTRDGKTIRITSLAELQRLNQDVGMGAANRFHNANASAYDSHTPYWWPKESFSHVSWDGSHLDYARFQPQPPCFGGPGGWSPYGW